MRTVFFGTPEIALPALGALTQISEVVGVVCQPDRPAGRGMQLRAPAIKSLALELGLPIYQPAKVRTGELQSWLADRRPDVVLVLAYGRILPSSVLGVPRYGCINLHASLLPRHRGAAPIQWSILAGDAQTGISLMQMDEGLDSGPVYYQRAIEVLPTDDAGSLTDRLGRVAAEVVTDALPRAVSGELPLIPQDPTLVTLAPPIGHADQVLHFGDDALALQRRVRALAPKPGAIAQLGKQRLKILSANVASEQVAGPPGSVRLDKRRVLVATGAGTLEITRLQFEGKPPQSATDVVNGRKLADSDLLQSPQVLA